MVGSKNQCYQGFGAKVPNICGHFGGKSRKCEGIITTVEEGESEKDPNTIGPNIFLPT